MKKSHFTEQQIFKILESQNQGKTVEQICREHGISNGTFFTDGKVNIRAWKLRKLSGSKSLNRRNSKLRRSLYRRYARQCSTQHCWGRLPTNIQQPKVITPRGRECWNMAFMQNRFYCGQKFRLLNIADDHNREMVAIEIGYSISQNRERNYLGLLW